MADYYEVLHVPPTAEPEVIRSAFRALARRFHPDFGGDQAVMMAINEAWSVLGDRRRRAAYDASRNGARLLRGQYTSAGRYEWSPQRTQTTVDRARPAGPTESVGPLAAAAERRAEARGMQGPGASGTVLDFGRYAGWSVAAIARQDPDYLLWLERTPVGRPYGPEIRQALERSSGPVVTATAAAATKRRLFQRHRAR